MADDGRLVAVERNPALVPVARALVHFGLDVPGISRWGESDAGPPDPRRTTSKEEQACPGLTTS